jgi:hypothetical protein
VPVEGVEEANLPVMRQRQRGKSLGIDPANLVVAPIGAAAAETLVAVA